MGDVAENAPVRASTPEAPPPLRRDRDFRRYAAARAVSIIGSVVTYIAMPVLVYELTRSNFWTGVVVVVEALPYVCWGLYAGALADRIDRRRVMVASDVLNGVLLASIPVAYLLDLLTVPHVLVVGFAVQSGFVFFDAANFGALPTLVGVDRIAAAQSVIFSTSTIVELAVPGVVGAALAVVPAGLLLAVNAATFVASALLIRAIVRPLWNPERTAVTRQLRREIGDGLRFLWGQPVIRVLTMIGMAQTFAGGAFMGQLIPWSDQALGVSPGDSRLGLLFTAWAAGSLLASVAYPRLARWLGEARVTLLALPLSALGAVACGLAPNWSAAMVLLGVWGIVYVITVINSVTLRQRITPEHLQSRVNTTGRMLSYGVGYSAGAFVAGVVSEASSPRTALVLTAFITAAGALAAWFSPLRTYRVQAAESDT